MNKETALKLFRTIKYPGFSRDIVSFGIIKDFEIENKNVIVFLNITSNDEKKKKEIVDAITAVLKESGEVDEVEIKEAEQIKRQPSAQPQNQWAGQSLIEGVKQTIAVASGKGGVGKSTVASNLAICLSKLGHSVGLLDCDVYGPSVPTIMGTNEKPGIGAGRKIIPLEKHGIKLMSLGLLLDDEAPVIWRGPIVAKLITQFIDDITWGDIDYLVMDLPPGTGDVQLTLAQKVKLTGAVIVTTPQDLALLDADKGAAMFRQVNAPVLGIVENMSTFLCPHCEEETDIFGSGGGAREALKLKVPFLGKVPIESIVRESGDDGIPVVINAPESASAKAFMEITERVISSIGVQEESPVLETA
ncbi:MAG: Mrp/NBP35 family ATP-binding protein [Candidatus Marinimicrobia bacterium]|nr:Mrp/NBP35 family ATP-binding protein [Candidatus Neomarinimicrobiota bacterium]